MVLAYFIKSTHFFAFCIILYLVERLRVGERSSGMRMASRVMPMMRRTSFLRPLRGTSVSVCRRAVVHVHFVEDEEEGVMGGLGLVFFLDAAVGGEVDGLVVVDEAFVVVV